MSNITHKNNDEIEMKLLAIKILPLMTAKLEAEIAAIEVLTGYPHYKLLLKQMQFIYTAFGITDKTSDFLSGKLEINPPLKAVFRNYLLNALKLTEAPLSKIRIISQRIAQIKTS